MAGTNASGRSSSGGAVLVRSAVAACVLLASSPVPAATLLQWDIPVSASGAAGTTNGSSPTNGAGGSGVSGSQITLNGSIAGTTSSSGWRWYDGSSPATDLTTAISSTNYFSWSVTTNGVTTGTINGLGATSFSRGSTAPTSLGLLYSTDSGFSSYRVVSGTTTIQSASTDISSGLTGDLSSNPIVLAPASTGYFRLAYWGATTTTSGAIWTGSASTSNDFSLLGAVASAPVRTLTWSGTSGSAWNTTTSNLVWTVGGTSTWFNDSDNAVFTGATTANVAGGGINAGTVAVSNTSGSVVFQGGSLNAGALTKTGAGTLELTVSNTFTSVSATSGAIQIAANGSLGSNGVGLDGTQLTTTSAVTTVANAINVASGGATLSVGGTAAFTGVINTVSAAANTSYALTKAGAGALTIDKTLGTQMTKNTSGGAFTLGVTDGSLTLSGATQKNLGGAMTWDGSVSMTGGTVMLHAGTVTGSGTVSIDGATTISSRLNFGRSTIANRTVVNSPTTLTASAGSSLEMTGTMSGSGGITTNCSTTGQVRLKGVASTLSGTLAIGGSGTTEVYSAALGSLTPGISAGATLRFINPVDGTFAGPIAGAGALVISCTSAKQTLSGANTYAGATTVEAGTLVINGTNSGAGATAVALNAILGGTGSLAGAITFAAGSQFLFNAAGPLTVPGSVSFTDASSFGIDDIVGLDSNVADGTYSLLAGTVDTTNLANLGSSNAYSLGSGKTAYFQSSGGLNVVVVPEPATLSLLSGVALASLLVRIRRSRRGA